MSNLIRALEDRRRGCERRRRSPYLTHWYWGIGGRRTAGRRATDMAGVQVDRYSASLLMAVVSIFLLSQADSLLTLVLVASGRFVELNPIMALLLERGPVLFVSVRSILWGLTLVALVVVSSRTLFGRVRGTRVIYGLVLAHFIHFLGALFLLQTGS